MSINSNNKSNVKNNLNLSKGSFSETTTASFSVDMSLGAIDEDKGVVTGDGLGWSYGYDIGLGTSFTGEDSLSVAIDAGSSGVASVGEFNQSTGDGLILDGVTYTFPVGDATVMVGDNTDGSDLFTSACTYSAFTDYSGNCGSGNAGITGGGATVGAAYDFGTGFTAAFGAQTEGDVFTDESANPSLYALNAAYTGDDYGISVGYRIDESKNANSTSFGTKNEFTSALGTGKLTKIGNKEKANNTSFGYDALNGEFGSDETQDRNFLVGLSYDELGPGSFGLGIAMTSSQADEEYQYEAYYSYPINDGMTITPLVYIQNQDNSSTVDSTGTTVTASFSFSGKRNAKNKKNKLISLGKKPKQQQQKKNKNNSGFHQTAFGKKTLNISSGNSNTAFGTQSGTSIKKGNRNTLIGNSTDISEENGLAQLVIGHGAKGHGNYIGVLGGSNKEEKSNKQTALKAIIPSVNNYTNLGSKDYRYKELFVNKLNNGVEYTLPTESDINKDDLMISDNNGKLSFKTLDKFKGFYVERTNASKSKQKIESSDGVATMSVDDIIKSQGRIYLDTNTTSIKFTSSAKDFIKKLGLTKDYDFTSNLYIFTESTTDLNPIDSKVEVDDTDNISLTYFTFTIFSTKQSGDLAFGGTSTRLVIRRLTSEKIEIEFSL